MASWDNHAVDTLGSRGTWATIVEGGSATAHAIGGVSTGANTITISGVDVSAIYPIGSRLAIFGSTGNDGSREVLDVQFSTDTVITVEDIPNATADGSIARLDLPAICYYMLDGTDDIGKLRYAQCDEFEPSASDDWTLITVDAGVSATINSINPPSTILLDGDVSAFFLDGSLFSISSGPYAGGYTVSGDATYDGGSGLTTVIVAEALSATAYPVLAVDATHFSVAGNHIVTLAAGVAFVVDGSAANDGEYTSVDAVYDAGTGRTAIEVAAVPNTGDATGNIYRQIVDGENAAETGGTGYDAVAKEFGGLVHCAYTHRRYGYIEYARATVPGPADSGDFSLHRVKQSLSAARHLSLASVDGLPHIAYSSLPDQGLRYTYSDDAEPASSANWTDILIHSGLPSSFRNLTPALLGGSVPKFFSVGDNKIWNYTAGDATPTLAADFTELQTTEVAYAPSPGFAACVNDGFPLIAFRGLLTDKLQCQTPFSLDIYSADASADEFEVEGDYSELLDTGATFTVVGSAGNDASYTSTGASYSGGSGRTTISVADVADDTDNGRIYISPQASADDFPVHTIDTGADYGEVLAVATIKVRLDVDTADATANEFTVDGDYSSEFAAGRMFRVFGSTGNDLTYVSTGAAYATGTTTISVANVADDTDDGRIELLDERPVVFYTDAGTPKQVLAAIADRPNPSATIHWTVETVYTGEVGNISARQIGDFMFVALYDKDTWDLVVVVGTF